MASQPFLVPKTLLCWSEPAGPSAVRRRRVSPTATCQRLPSFLPQGCEPGTGNPRDNGEWKVALSHDADHGMERSHQFVSATWEEVSFVLLWAEARSGCRVTRPSWTKVGEGCGQGDWSNREVFPSGSVFCSVAGDSLSSPWRLFRRREGRWFVQQDGAGHGQLAFFRQGRGAVVESHLYRHVVVAFRLSSPFLGRPE